MAVVLDSEVEASTEDKPAEDVLYPDENTEVEAEETKAEADPEADKADAEEANEADKDKDEDVDPEGAERIEVKADDLKFPEGVEVNADIQEKFLSLVNNKDMKPAEVAQAMVDLQQDLYKGQADAVEAQSQQWEADTKAHPELGGDNLTETLSVAEKGMAAVDVKGLSELMVETKLGNNPIMIEAFYKIGKSISEDGFVKGSNIGKEAAKSDAQVLYPNM